MTFMEKFKSVDYESSIALFEKAELTGDRLKLGELATSKWLQAQNINLDDVVEFSKSLPDSKIFIIGAGVSQGFYIYSQKQKTCFKFEHEIAEFKPGNIVL
jgi:glutamate mutase epsilon subunit